MHFSLKNTPIQDWNLVAIMNIGRSIQELHLGNVGLTSWPAWILYFSNLTELIISDSSISYIPANAFNTVVHTLVKLSLTNTNLTYLPRAFSQLYRLEWLTVEGANVETILWLPFSSNLTSLYLANNNISNAEQVSVCPGPYAYSLQYVDLQGNKLTSIPELAYMINLHYLNLNHNHIALPETGSLPTRIGRVDLGLNSLPLIPHFFSGLFNVWYLNLPHNLINELRGEDFPPIAIIANFGYNQITNLTEASFPNVSNITCLSLNDNPIASISLSAFRNLASLSFLNLQQSELTRLPLALCSLSNLHQLDMSGSADLVCTCAERDLQSLIVNTPEVNGECGDTTILYFFTNLTSGCDEL
ncbi:unnamed protein product [Candidula unifasciata]|uniref:Uncharacterized protein n=1 Tax=Candidula unifasciata TaxID=100452 RepID=A0A8S3ZL65_9EUPU|nr:unnamed protein product [Candidula unifasciata]